MSGDGTTVIRNAAWIAAWDGSGHRYLRDGDVAFTGDRIVHVGGPYEGAAGRSIDGARRFVMPGLVDIHSHPHTEPAYKGVREDHGVPEMYDTGLYERSCALSLDEPGRRAAMEMAYAELLLCGVTTLVDLSRCDRVVGWTGRGAAACALTSVPSSPTPSGSSRTGTSCSSTGTRRAAGATSTTRSASWTSRSSTRAGGSAASSTPARSRPAPRRRCATPPPTRTRAPAR